jgi:hypothetical protein
VTETSVTAQAFESACPYATLGWTSARTGSLPQSFAHGFLLGVAGNPEGSADPSADLTASHPFSGMKDAPH